MKINILFQKATKFHVEGDLDNAEKLYQHVLNINHRNFDSIHRLAILYAQKKNYDSALNFFNKAVSINPVSVDLLFNLSNVYLEINKPNESLFNIDKAILLDKNNSNLYFLQGNAYKQLLNFENAINSYDTAINLNALFFEAYCNRGVVHKELHNFELAIKDFSYSIKLNNNSCFAFTNRAAIYIELKIYDKAFDDLNAALSIQNDFEDALYNLSTLYKNTKQLDNAIKSYKSVLEINPNNIESIINLAVLLQETGEFDSAYALFLRALDIEPEFRFNRSTFLTLKCKLCIWDNFDEELDTVITEVFESTKIATPFHLLGLIDRPDLHLVASKDYVSKECPTDSTLGSIAKHSIGDRIRIGYFSADFHNHATSYLMAELFEIHDKSKFELYAFSFGPKRNDEMYKRLLNIFDHFIEVGEMKDQEIAVLSRESFIDIAVDLKGFTQDARPNIFAKRCAPIQISYLGYPGTLGADYMDFIIADRFVIPENFKQYYTENILYMPHSYQVNDSKRFISNKIFSRSDFGLPESSFVFCCFNNCYKILPNIFDIWMDILKNVNNSVLWLLDDNPTASSNLLKEAERRGIEKNRLFFAQRMKLEDHLARHRLADLFLDTLPYNAHTTASDSLWAGLPVLTCTGESFASRVGASLLNNLDLHELVTANLDDYTAKAIFIANNPDFLRSLKEKLLLNLKIKPLFDTKLFAKNLEKIYSDVINDSFDKFLH